MADHLDLSSKDYEDIIEHCTHCTISNYIPIFLWEKLRKYYNTNPTMVNHLISIIELKNAKGEIELGEIDEELPEEVYFNEHGYDSTCPQITWLYNYLSYLIAFDNQYAQLIEITNVHSENSNEIDLDKSFACMHSSQKLEALYNFLKKENFISGSFEQFEKIFTAVPLSEIKKISWISKKTKGADNKSIFLILHYLSPLEVNKHCADNFICDKIDSCFEGFSISGLVSGYSEWHPNEEIALFKKKGKPINKIFRLLTYLEDNFPPNF